MRVSVDRELCIGSGSCVFAEPSVFRQDDQDGLVALIVDRPDPSVLESARIAVAGCPVGAIALRE